MVANLVLPQPAAVGDEWGNSLNVAVQSVNSDVEALKVRSIGAGLGLTGGGDLTQNRTLAVDFAASGVVSATKATRADDTRLSDARTPLAHTHLKSAITDFAHAHPISDVTSLQAALDAKSATGHVHTTAQVTGLDTALALTGANTGRALRLAASSSSLVGVAYNAVIDSGWYVMDSAAANAPVAATCYLEVRAYSTTYVEQTARHVITGAQYRRYMNAGAWGAWSSAMNPTTENMTLGGASGWISTTKAYRRLGSVTIHLSITRDSQSGTGPSNSAVTSVLPAGWRPLENAYGLHGTDLSSGGDVSWYVTAAGQIMFVFGRGAGAGTNATVTYVCDQA